MNISQEYNEARLSGGRAFLDLGADRMRLQFMGGQRPDPGDPAGLPLAELPLDKPCGTVSDNRLTLIATDTALVLVSGEVTWARAITAANKWAFDCSVSDMTGNGEIKLLSTTVYAGGKIALVSGVLG